MFVLLLALAVAEAEPEGADEDGRVLAERHSPERGEIDTDNGLSARVLAGAATLEGDGALFGVGVAYERDLFHGIIAVEVALEAFTGQDSNALMAELVVEKPIELTDEICLYFGGGMIGLAHAEHGKQGRPGIGGLALLGVEYDLGGGFEVFAELDTALLAVPEPILEADVGTGVMWRF